MNKGFTYNYLSLPESLIIGQSKEQRMDPPIIDYINSGHDRSGFTLIELSIVLVIIALIVAGIMGGRELVRAAEVQSVIADINGFKTAINSFQMQYDAMPGDMSNAIAYWGVVTADGDGDNSIDWKDTAPLAESYRAWQHMTLAEILPGGFTGIEFSGNPKAEIDTNIPGSRIDGTGYSIGDFCPAGLGVTCAGTMPPTSVNVTRRGEAIRFGTLSLAGGRVIGGGLNPKDAKSIDRKMDDSDAREGNVIVLAGGPPFPAPGNSENCLETAAGVPNSFTGVQYNLKAVSPNCMMIFYLSK